jgi:hypothetical protein
MNETGYCTEVTQFVMTLDLTQFAPNWPMIATEALKLLAGAAIALLIGFVAHRRGWIGQKEWDTTKYRYEIFKEEQRRRLQLLGEMRECVHLIEDAVLVSHSSEMIRHKLATDHGRDMTDSDMRCHTSRIVEANERFTMALGRLELAARQYGQTPETDDFYPCSMPDLVRHVKASIEQHRHNAPFDWEKGRSELLHDTGALSTVLFDVALEEQEILMTTHPEDAKTVFRNRQAVRVFNQMRTRKTSK